MRQLVQSVDSGELRILEVPRPSIGATEVLVATSHSVISAGTERAARNLATASLLGKARARPDLVRQIIRKARADGIAATAGAVRARLRTEMPLGYSAAGMVLEVGEAVRDVKPGQRVATGGAGHADLQVVQGPLAVAIPDAVSSDAAAFATVGSIAMHGLRLAEAGPGARICVIGLGLLGQLTVRLALAAGMEVVGIDLRHWTLKRAADAGAFAVAESGSDTTEALLAWSRGRGVDAVLITAATASSDPMLRAPAISRDRATIVVVGDVGLQLQRTPLYEKELTLRFARSYGPGRYDLSYEEWGVDYPIGHVRWTEGRNIESVLDLLANGRLRVNDLVTHTFPLARAAEAYALVSDTSRQFLGVQITYEGAAPAIESPPTAPRAVGGTGVGLIGAGTYARATLVPALKQGGLVNLVAVASAAGLSASSLARQAGFRMAVDSAKDVIDDREVHLVVVATPHDSHEELTIAALEAGKHVFCEKPLALSIEGLQRVAQAWRANSGRLWVGFNRRYSPSIAAVRKHFGDAAGPLVITYRVNAGAISERHWYHDRRQGGRLIGEVCHFIDTCSYLMDAPVISVSAVGSGRGETLLQQDVVVTLCSEDGSVATISYASGGHPRTPKERIEVLGRGHSAVVDDFRRIALDGTRKRGIGSDKGHVAQFAAVRQSIESRVDDVSLTLVALESMSVTIAAAESLVTGGPIKPAVI